MAAQPRLKEQYDWVVMGSHPGALLAACLAARAGQSVLVAPLGPKDGVRASKDNIPLDPESNWILGLGRGERMNGLVHQCLSEIGLSPAESEKIKQPRAPFTLVSPQLRLSLMMENEAFVRELRRELGEAEAAKLGLSQALHATRDPIVEHWFHLPDRLKSPPEEPGGKKPRRPRLVSHDRATRDLFRRLSRSSALSDKAQRVWAIHGKKAQAQPAIQELVAGLRAGAFGIGFPGDELSDLALDRALEGAALASAGARFEGGLSSLRSFLLDVARRAGAQVVTDTDVSQIFIEGGKFVGVQLSQKGSMIACSSGLIGCALEHAQKKVSTSGSSWLKRPAVPPPPIGWKFSISVIARAEAIPAKVSDRLIWLEKGSPAIEIEIADCEDYDFAEAGSQIIFCRTVLPYTKESLNPRSLRLVASRMFKKLSELFPFLEFHVTSVFPDFRSAISLALDEISEAYPYHAPADLPESLRCYSGARGLRTHSGIEGLHVASGESYPQWGSLGAVVAGLEAVARGGLAQKAPG